MPIEELIAWHAKGRATGMARIARQPSTRTLRERVGRATMTRALPGEMTATVPVRALREALA